MINYYSNGKLLITGEYLVLDGALALAVPTQYGQSLTVETIDELKLLWKSIDYKGGIWFEVEFNILDKEILHISKNDKNNNEIANKLLQILSVAKQFNPHFLNSNIGYKVTSKLDFPQLWGLGTSSTLINNIAQWSKVDAYQLLEQTFNGSGYDIASAQHNFSITYQLKNDKRLINKVDFNPKFKDNLFFVHLNKKQNSRDGIKQYNSNRINSTLAISEISNITSKIVTCTSLNDFEALITSHEHIVSKIIKQEPIKNSLFNNYKGAIKSLGAWGGDFILATGNKDSFNYFKSKGYHTVIPFTKMVLK